jgi:hypothetical protein
MIWSTRRLRLANLIPGGLTLRKFGVVVWLAIAGQAFAQPINFVTITESTEKCPRYALDPALDRFRVYIENTHDHERISANVRSDTMPSGQSFSMLDYRLGDYTEQFPSFYEHRLAPKERKQIACTAIARIAADRRNFLQIPIHLAVVGAVFVDPSAPVPPPEDAKQYLLFMIKNLPNNNGGCRSNNPGFYYVTNTHPTRSISAHLSQIDDRGATQGPLLVDLTPQRSNRVGCTRADRNNFTITGVESAMFTTPP